MPYHKDVAAMLVQMRSLKLIILRCSPNPRLELEQWNDHWCKMVAMTKKLCKALSMVERTSRHCLAVLCPDEIVSDTEIKDEWENVEANFDAIEFESILKSPCDWVLDRFEVGIPDQWKGIWPGKGKLIERSWIAHEVV
jgi:hypothetical protein